MEQLSHIQEKAAQEITEEIATIDAQIMALDSRIPKVSGEEEDNGSEIGEDAAATQKEMEELAGITAEKDGLMQKLAALRQQLQDIQKAA